MNLTREQAIIEHRKMWNWIAEECLKRKKKVLKADYLFNENKRYYPPLHCYCCGYAMQHVKDYDDGYPQRCRYCPIDWGSNGIRKFTCIEIFNNSNGLIREGLYRKYELLNDNNYKVAASLAKQIAELPERIIK